MMERTLIFLKPDGVERGIVGRVLSRFEDAGFKIVGMKMVWVDKDFAKQHYAAHVQKPFYNVLEEFVTAGPVVAAVLEGVHAAETVRKMVGSTEPKTAAPGTIRGDFAQHSYAYADKKGVAIKNIIHASESAADAKKEIALWFTPAELHSYARMDERHVN